MMAPALVTYSELVGYCGHNTLVPTAPKRTLQEFVCVARVSPDETRSWTPIDTNFARLCEESLAVCPIIVAETVAGNIGSLAPELRDSTFGRGLGGDASKLLWRTKM